MASTRGRSMPYNPQIPTAVPCGTWFCSICAIGPGVRKTATSSTTTAQSG